ncbi:GNAT family N-acetyltransferase [Robiginitalea aurantiaca]|uniref:GNAT family N-acetyltransferase n=1 Tax=Robiginitalea aurantiaca TaxID=3056915 RepID=A0ABT7WB44_9FLAO|nr:GNAT family N-acetyltransferase [Robiginitalea aurantiaca]MDM9630139.1 GNAT family N-acetyltransferase [Robiginitalea aurantiaca]
MNEKITFTPASTRDDIQGITRLAEIIWREHYIPIIGKPQVDYMLEHFQSGKAIQEQLERGVFYFSIRVGAQSAGYLAFEKREQTLFLSKIYLLDSFRGKGIGKRAMAFVEEKAHALNCHSITLTVNKYNDRSINAYSTMGFKITGGEITDIGGGFAMDDYRMEKEL